MKKIISVTPLVSLICFTLSCQDNDSVADFEKMKGGTQDKYFYAAADTGFISKNVYLYCASEGLSTVVVGWVNKSKLAKIMKLGYKQNIILVQPVGYRR